MSSTSPMSGSGGRSLSGRRFAGRDGTLAVMTASAAGKALAQAGLQPAGVGCMIAATMSFMYQAAPPASEITALHWHHMRLLTRAMGVSCSGCVQQKLPHAS
jgi:3-oxoacyl-[acyl-carrier-protein] synthase III